MERFFEKITRALVENGNIREEEEEVYQYALKSMRPTEKISMKMSAMSWWRNSRKAEPVS